MNVRLESMCHGDGKVYLQMVVEKIHADARVLLEAHLKDGSKIPAHLFPLRSPSQGSSANYVVVLPHFEVREVDLAFLEYAAPGTPLSQSRLTVELNTVRWKTRLNTLVRNELTEQMLDIEREYCADRMNIYFTDAIDDGAEVVVKMLVDMPHVPGADVMVSFFDLDGRERDLLVYPLVDEIIPEQRFGEGERLHVGFSVRVRNDDKAFCVTVYDVEELIPGGFAVFSKETHEPLREAFLYLATDASKDTGYARWYQRHCETIAGLAVQRSARFAFEPLVGLVLPLCAGDECFLAATLRALRRQTYSNFELLVVDAGIDEVSYSAAVREWEEDGRLVHMRLTDPTDEAQLRLTGLLQSQGDVCAVLEPNVILAPEALFEYVRRINEARSEQEAQEQDQRAQDQNQSDQDTPDTPEAQDAPDTPDVLGGCDVVYANHDIYKRDQGFFSPVLKPIYSPDLLYSYNYLGPLVFFSRRVLHEIAQTYGFATEAFGYDLALKATACAKRIERIDAVLYHVQDPASFSEEKVHDYESQAEEAFRGGRKAVANQLRRQNVDAVVLADLPQQLYRVQYRLPKPQPSLSVIIPSKDQVGLLSTCLASLFESNNSCAYEVVIVDNASEEQQTLDYYDELVKSQHSVRIMSYEGSFNQAAMINAAVATGTSQYLMLLDNDTEMITPELLSALLAHCCREDVGVVGAKLLFADDTIQHAGMMVGSFGSAANIGVNLPRSTAGYQRRLTCAHNLTSVSGAAMMVKRSVFDQVGGFDERFLISCYDVDFCCKVRKEGYLVAYNGGIELYHQENATTGHVLTTAQRLRAERERAFLHYRWPRYFVEGDPYFSSAFDQDAPYYLLGA